jgi:hypothetical protein
MKTKFFFTKEMKKMYKCFSKHFTISISCLNINFSILTKFALPFLIFFVLRAPFLLYFRGRGLFFHIRAKGEKFKELKKVCFFCFAHKARGTMQYLVIFENGLVPRIAVTSLQLGVSPFSYDTL